MPISISPATFITDVLNTVDLVIGTFVQSGYAHLVRDNVTTITALFVFYIVGLGYRFIHHTLDMDLNTVAKHLTLLLIVYGLLMNWSLYSLFFFNLFTNEPGVIAQSLVDGSGMLPPGKDAAAALNIVFAKGMNAATVLMHQGNFVDIWPWIYALLITFMTLAFGVAALLLFVYAKIALSVILVLGPLFLLFLLWSSTRGFFEKWLQALVNYGLIPIVTSALLMLILAIDNTLLPGLETSTSSGSPHFSGIWPYLAFCLLGALLLKQVLPICSALSGGMALEALSNAKPIADKALQTTGLKNVASNAKQFGAGERLRIKQERSTRSQRVAQTKASRNL